MLPKGKVSCDSFLVGGLPAGGVGRGSAEDVPTTRLAAATSDALRFPVRIALEFPARLIKYDSCFVLWQSIATTPYQANLALVKRISRRSLSRHALPPEEREHIGPQVGRVQ
jgi:hypothetical protein